MIRRCKKFLRYFYNEPEVVIKGLGNKLIRILSKSKKPDLTIYMGPPEIEHLKRYLLDRNIKNILEWGSGGSTILFGKFLDENGKKHVNWYSIEHDIVWYNKIKEKNIRENTHIYYLPVDENNHNNVKNKNYVEFPRTLGVKFDLVLVDARYRRRCLIEAAKHLSPSGIVILHDAPLRKQYHCAFQHYRYGKFTVGTIWEGTNE